MHRKSQIQRHIGYKNLQFAGAKTFYTNAHTSETLETEVHKAVSAEPRGSDFTPPRGFQLHLVMNSAGIEKEGEQFNVLHRTDQQSCFGDVSVLAVSSAFHTRHPAVQQDVAELLQIQTVEFRKSVLATLENSDEPPHYKCRCLDQIHIHVRNRSIKPSQEVAGTERSSPVQSLITFFYCCVR